MKERLKRIVLLGVLLSLNCVLAVDADKLCTKDNITLKECLNELKSVIQAQNTQLKTLIPGEWNNLILPPNWNAWNGTAVQCRRNAGWIEFKGVITHSQIQGWPGYTYNMLPETCRPEVLRYTLMLGHIMTFGVGAYVFYPNGDISFYTNQPSEQQLLEGIRIWGGK